MVRSVLSAADSAAFSTKKKFDTIEDCHRLVTVKYPKAYRHGSCGSWHWRVYNSEQEEFDDYTIVAEAWAGRNQGWWLRVRQTW